MSTLEASARAPEAFLLAEQRRVNAALARIQDRHLPQDDGGRVAAAASYALEAGGKRLRPILCVAAWRAVTGEPGDEVYELAAALELIHTYSLVHDDLPCMDDDDLRRGRPTTHRQHGLDVAVVAGAALIPLAADVVAGAAGRLELPGTRVQRLVGELAQAAGGAGMVGGQLLDLLAEGRRVALDELERVHRLKTGALLRASLRIGAIAADADAEQLRALDEYGRCVGLAFQIADDVLDVTATSAELGKTAGRDEALEKSTYPALLGLEQARLRAQREAECAVEALRAAGIDSPELEHLARYAVSRRN